MGPPRLTPRTQQNAEGLNLRPVGELPPIPTAPDKSDALITSCCSNPTARVWSEVACQWERKGGLYVPGPANHTSTVAGTTARGEASTPAPRAAHAHHAAPYTTASGVAHV